MILEWCWIAPEYYSSDTNITWYHQYHEYYIILPILHYVTNQRFTNITQYYISNITQYSMGGIQYQYYSILPILLKLTSSILLNIQNFQNCVFSIQCVNIHQYYKPLPIFINITQYYLSNLEMLHLNRLQWSHETSQCTWRACMVTFFRTLVSFFTDPF